MKRLPRKIKKHIKKDNYLKILDKDSKQAILTVYQKFKRLFNSKCPNCGKPFDGYGCDNCGFEIGFDPN